LVLTTFLTTTRLLTTTSLLLLLEKSILWKWLMPWSFVDYFKINQNKHSIKFYFHYNKLIVRFS
jgi:hypothetical protein